MEYFVSDGPAISVDGSLYHDTIWICFFGCVRMKTDGVSLRLESEDLGGDLGEDVRVGLQEFCCVSLCTKGLGRYWSIVHWLDPKIRNKLT